MPILILLSLSLGIFLGYYGSYLLYIIIFIILIILTDGPTYNLKRNKDIAWTSILIIFFGLLVGDFIKYFKLEYLTCLLDK